MSLVLDDLHRSYDGTPAVAGVSLELEGDATLALLGPSGCGKSTLLRLVAGLEPPDRGRIALDGRDITREAPQRRAFGMVFQDYALFPHLDVAANVAFGLVELGWARAERDARVAELLELVELPGLGRRRIGELSGGQQQRVALARALAPRPRVLLLDEPLSNLDQTLREGLKLELAALLGALGVRAIYVTHDQGEAFALADRIALMRAGRIVQADARDALLERPETPWAARFLGHRNVFEGGAPEGAPVRGPALLRGDLVRLASEGAVGGAPGVPATVARASRDGRLWRLELDVPAWGGAPRIVWEGFTRELPAEPRSGLELRLIAPDDAWIALTPDPGPTPERPRDGAATPSGAR